MLPGGRWSRAVLFTTVAGCALAFGLGAARAETLMEAMILAYQNNPTLQAQRANLRATVEGVPQALAGWRPFVEIVGEGGFETNHGDSFDGTESGGTYGASLRVTQNIYAGGGTVADVQRAEDTVRAERARLSSIEQTVLLNAVQAYMNVFRDDAVLRLNVYTERVLARQLEATRDRFNVGEVTRTDVSQAEARVSGATADRIQAEGDVQISRGIYEQVVGKMPDALQKPAAIVDLPGSRQESIQVAMENNPDVLAALYDERASVSNVKVQTSDLLPRVDVVGQGGRTSNEVGSSVTNDGASIVAQLTVPLYQRGFATSRVREAKQVVGRNRMRLIEARRAATEDSNNGWETLVTARARINSFTAAVRANRIALEGVRQEALVGSRTVLDVLDAEQELLDSQVNLVRAERDETVAQYQLMSAVGRLTAPSLNLGTEYYDPSHHYNKVRDKLWGLGEDLDKPGAQPQQTK
jgi:TolC family type I secretion outer membrane protein